MNFVHTGMISSQGCEPKTESRFFGRFFSVFPDRKPTFLNRFFGCPKKQKPKNRLGFFGRFFSHVPYANNAYISVLKPRYVWTVL